MKIYLAADHAGFEAKALLMARLESLGHDVEDCGAFSLDGADDYPDFVLLCAHKVANDPGSFGILLGASGQGEAMVANRVAGVRAAVYYGKAEHTQTDATGAELGLVESARLHNDANVLSLGARFLLAGEAEEAVLRFLQTPFSGDERHMRRIAKF
jgi:ribose 5-phosphate isomerase B